MAFNRRFLSVGKIITFSVFFFAIFLFLKPTPAQAISCGGGTSLSAPGCDLSPGVYTCSHSTPPTCVQLPATSCPNSCISTDPQAQPETYSCRQLIINNPVWPCNSSCNGTTLQTATSCGTTQNTCNYSYTYNSTTCGYNPPSTCYSPDFCASSSMCNSANGLQVMSGSCYGGNVVCCGAAPYCGDGVCGAGENSCTCASDCPGTCNQCSPPCSDYAGYCNGNTCNEYTTYCSGGRCVQGSLMAYNTSACNGVPWNGSPMSCPINIPIPAPGTASCTSSTGTFPFTWDPTGQNTSGWGIGVWYCDTSTSACARNDYVQVGGAYGGYPNQHGTTTLISGHNYAWLLNYTTNGNGTSIDVAAANFTCGTNTFSTTGQVYVDQDKNGQINGTDHAYTGSSLTVTICAGNQPGGCSSPFETLTTNPANGTFTTAGATSLPSGSYTAILTIPSGYQAISPRPPIMVFTVGASCQATAPASCDAAGNIQNLNFGILNFFPWMQTTGGDILNNGFTDNIPVTADSACSGGAYASAIGAGGTPGIINTGSGDANFGQGQASAKNWLVGGLGSGNYPYIYNLPLSKETRTSYDNLSYLVHQSNIQTKLLTDLPGCSSASCRLPADIASFPSGVYTIDGPLVLNSDSGIYTFPSGGNYVILVNGALTINTKIKVPNGAFVLFSSNGDLNVDSNVGDTAHIVASNLEGYYSTDRSFNALGKGTNGAAVDCSGGTQDLRLNIAGSIVVNANTANNGSFNYNRDMCVDNSACPVLSITERPDFILNAPTFLMFPRRIWQEVAP